MRRIRDTAVLSAVAVLLAVTVATTPVQAAEGRCLITVKRHTYLKGRCDINIQSGGSFTVGVGEQSRSKHFAYVTLDSEPGKASGYWNGTEGDDHAHEALGSLKRRGACWSNSSAKVCAWQEK